MRPALKSSVYRAWPKLPESAPASDGKIQDAMPHPDAGWCRSSERIPYPDNLLGGPLRNHDPLRCSVLSTTLCCASFPTPVAILAQVPLPPLLGAVCMAFKPGVTMFFLRRTCLGGRCASAVAGAPGAPHAGPACRRRCSLPGLRLRSRWGFTRSRRKRRCHPFAPFLGRRCVLHSFRPNDHSAPDVEELRS